MTDEQKNACHGIIHTHAAAAAGGNLVPVPGTGLAADIVALTTMTMALGAVFGKRVEQDMAINFVTVAIKDAAFRFGLTEAIKETFGKLIPPLSSAMSFAMLESVGWSIANKLDNL